MNTRAYGLVLATAVLTILATSPLHAQEGSWTFRGTGEFGAFLATRDLAKNVTGVEVNALQITAKMENALSWSAGGEMVSPDERTVYRAVVRNTISGQSIALPIQCKNQTGELCEPNTAKARLTSFHGEVVFVQGNPGDTFRQNFIIGAGLRSYQFSVQACASSSTNPDVKEVCERSLEIYEDQAQVQPFIQFGFGFSHENGPLTYFVRVNDVLGKYSGGAGNADGDFQNDIYLVGGISFRVR